MIAEVFPWYDPFLFGGYMEAYRHVNVLVSERIYDSLRESSFKQKKSISAIVRKGIDLVLKNKTCKHSEDVKND